MTEPVTLSLADEKETERLGANLAGNVAPGAVIFLHGDLGAGKTTLVRGFLRKLGHEGAVKSPTYTLLEPYRMDTIDILHCDFYRIVDPDEIIYLGLDDFPLDQMILLVEWPQICSSALPDPTIDVHLEYTGDGARAAKLTTTSSNLLDVLRDR